jgi:septal ring factor EnvC (AmiA/AmiB activator)
MTLKKVAMAVAGLSLAVTNAAWAVPEVHEARAALEQGGFYVGMAAPGARVSWQGQPVPVAADGRFFIGFDRLQPARAVLRVCEKGACAEQELRIAARKYVVQQIHGVPADTVNPTAAELKLMKADSAAIHEARGHLSAETAFERAFAAPVNGPTTSVYGSRRVYNGEERSWHNGHDFAVPRGTPVKAPAAGIVRLARPTFMSGNLVILDHGGQLFTVYAHLSKMLVKVGQPVRAGTVLGLVGTTGRSTGPHLHWGAYWRNDAIDPMLLIKAKERVAD